MNGAELPNRITGEILNPPGVPIVATLEVAAGGAEVTVARVRRLRDLAIPTLAHRLVVASAASGDPLGRAREEAERVLADLLERVPVPA